MANPKVSICIPAYKQPELLRKLLESVLIQDYKDYEIVVTDDSPDSSVEEVCAEYIKKNIPLTYIRNIERKGTPENWNEAIRHARGEYIKILHHDDWFLGNDSLHRFVTMLDKNPDANFAFSGSFWFNPDGKLQTKNKLSKSKLQKLRQNSEFLFAGNFIGTPSATIFRKNIGLFFDPQFKWLVDFEFYMRAIKTNGLFECTQEPLVGILTQSDTQVTAECLYDKNLQVSEYFRLYRKIHSANVNMKPYVFRCFWYLFDRFNIKSIEDIRNCEVNEEIPKEIADSFWFHRSIIFCAPIFIIKKAAGAAMRIYKIALSSFAFYIIFVNKFINKNK